MRYATQLGTDGVTYALVPADRIRHLAHHVEVPTHPSAPPDLLRRQSVEAMGREIAAKLFEHAKVRTVPGPAWRETVIHHYGFEVIVPEGPPRGPSAGPDRNLTVHEVWDYLSHHPGKFTLTDHGDTIEVRVTRP